MGSSAHLRWYSVAWSHRLCAYQVFRQQVLDAGSIRRGLQAQQNCDVVASPSGALAFSRQNAVDQGRWNAMALGPFRDADSRLLELRAGSADLIGREGGTMLLHIEILNNLSEFEKYYLKLGALLGETC